MLQEGFVDIWTKTDGITREKKNDVDDCGNQWRETFP